MMRRLWNALSLIWFLLIAAMMIFGTGGDGRISTTIGVGCLAVAPWVLGVIARCVTRYTIHGW